MRDDDNGVLPLGFDGYESRVPSPGGGIAVASALVGTSGSTRLFGWVLIAGE